MAERLRGLSMSPPNRSRSRAYPYYKVQSRDPRLNVWRDHRREAFDRLEDAIAFQAEIPPGLESRIMEWREDGSHVMTDDENSRRR
jgi:hypothetical protein